MPQMEPSLARQLMLEEFKRSLPQRSIEDLRQCCEQLAELAIVLQPAAMRWMAEDALSAMATAHATPGGLPPVTAVHEAMAMEVLQELGLDHHS